MSILGDSSEHKSEILSMYRALPTLSYTLRHYMAHRLRAKIQFIAINDLKEKLKSDQGLALLVIDHKQKILQKQYREGLEYYGKKGMSLLGVMLVTWSEEKKGFMYRFHDYVFKGHAGQDNVQVAAGLCEILR